MPLPLLFIGIAVASGMFGVVGTVKAGFALRRKTLVNSLQTGYRLPKEQLAEIVTSCGLSPTVRGERLTLADYARLTNALHDAAVE